MKFKKLRNSVLIAAIALPMSSCFDILEEFALKEDGSGSFSYTFNLTNDPAIVDVLFSTDSLGGFPVLKQDAINALLEKTTKIAGAADGISMSDYSANWDRYAFSFRCAFDSVEAFRSMLDSISKYALIGEKKLVMDSAFSSTDSSITRLSSSIFTGFYEKLTSFHTNELFEATYTCFYQFPRQVAETTNPDAKISSNGKSVLVRGGIRDFGSGQKSLVNTIFLE